MSRAARVAGSVAVLLAAVGCWAAPDDGPDPTRGHDAEVTPPPTSGGLDYQLGGAYDPAPGVTVVVRDSTEEPAPGVYSVCYVNGFQTQPAEAETWLRENPELVLHDSTGAVVDPAWPDEYVLDPRTPENREGILAIVGPAIERCAAAGYRAVEIDNLDTFARFDALSEDGNLALATAYADLAHQLGLAVGQKNAAEAAASARGAVGFDFAVTEECFAFGECTAYTDAYGEHVLQVEYADSLAVPFAEVCASPDRAPLVVLRDRGLVPAGVAGHVEERC